MIEREERTKEIIGLIKKKPQLEKELSEAIYPILQRHDIKMKVNEVLVFTPKVVDKPEFIWEAVDPCRFGICTQDWYPIKEAVAKIFSVERLEAFRKILGEKGTT